MFEVEKSIPIQAPKGCIGLYRKDGSSFYGRRVPENSIFETEVEEGGADIHLKTVKTVLSTKNHPETHDGKKVVGYEDPTFIPFVANTFELADGLVCTQTFEHDGEYGTTAAGEKLATNLVYFNPASNNPPRPILTPDQLQKAGLGRYVSMIKEGEFLTFGRGTQMIFEYVNTPPGNKGKKAAIGIAEFQDGKLLNATPFLDPAHFGYLNLSTCGGLLRLGNGQEIVMLNACTHNLEWGITWADIRTKKVHPKLVVRAPKELGRGYGNQLIAFGSYAERIGEDRVAVYYHSNDLDPHLAILKKLE